MPWKGCDWKGDSRVQGAPGNRQLVWHSPMNSSFFLLNTVPLKQRLPAISPAKRGLHRTNLEVIWSLQQWCATKQGPAQQENTFTEGEKNQESAGLFLDCVFPGKKRSLSPSWGSAVSGRVWELPPPGLLTLFNQGFYFTHTHSTPGLSDMTKATWSGTGMAQTSCNPNHLIPKLQRK